MQPPKVSSTKIRIVEACALNALFASVVLFVSANIAEIILFYLLVVIVQTCTLTMYCRRSIRQQYPAQKYTPLANKLARQLLLVPVAFTLPFFVFLVVSFMEDINLITTAGEWRGYELMLLGATLLSMTYSEYRFLRSHVPTDPVVHTSLQDLREKLELRWLPATYRAGIQSVILVILFASVSEPRAAENMLIVGTLLFLCMTFVDIFEITAMKRLRD